MNTLHSFAMFSAGVLLVGWSGLGVAEEPASFALAAKAYGFPVIDTTITFTRLAEHTYQVRYSNPPPSPDHLMLYSGFYFCAARKLALDAGFDRFALLPDADVAQRDPAAGGTTAFLKPGEEASKVLEPRFVSAQFNSFELVASNCPAQPTAAKP